MVSENQEGQYFLEMFPLFCNNRVVEYIVINKERNYATISGYIPLGLEEDRNYGLRTICRDCGIAECGEVNIIQCTHESVGAGGKLSVLHH